MSFRSKYIYGCLGVVLLISLISMVDCFDPLTWFLEVLPVYIGMVILAFLVSRGVNISNLLLGVIIIHMLILIVGGHYSYARVPLFDWLRQIFGWSRNNYDRVGHLVQGITPFLIAKELLMRKSYRMEAGLINVLSIAVALAFSALYELLEFAAAVYLQDGAEDFLGTQGDMWDTQKDMLCALIGATTMAIVSYKYRYQDNIPTDYD